jgi:hypothetical protein
VTAKEINIFFEYLPEDADFTNIEFIVACFSEDKK